MKKTEFEELYSLIKYGNRYDPDDLIFFYEDREGLRSLKWGDILEKESRLFTITRRLIDEWEVVQIPEYRFWVVTFSGMIIFDRRYAYTGPKDLSLPAHDDQLKERERDFLPLITCVSRYQWSGTLNGDLFANLNVSNKGVYYLYNYNNKAFVDLDHPILKRCRGLVVTPEGRIINYPFDRFFNYFQKEVATIDWTTARAYQKVDGTLICVWYAEDSWEVSTRGSFYPIEYRELEEYDVDFKNLFWEHFSGEHALDTRYCYMFELITEKNRNITTYQREFIVLLGMRHLESLEEIMPTPEMAKNLGVELPTTYPVADLDSCIELLSQFKDDEEGLVVVDDRFRRIKVKQESYFKLMKIKDLSKTDIFDYVLGKLDLDLELVEFHPEIKAAVDQMYDDWTKLESQILYTYQEVSQKSTDRKSFAQMATHYSYSSVLFDLLDNRDYRKRLNWESVKQWMSKEL